MIRLSGAIMAHPKRAAWAEELSADTGLPIVWDRVQSVWETASRAWRAHDPDATHHVVLQDDAVVCRDFVPSVEAFLKAVPPGVPSVLSVIDYRLHGDRRRFEEAVAAGVRVWRAFTSVHAVGMVLPTRDIEAALAFGDQLDRVTHDDFKLRSFYRQRGIKFAFPVPGLVQHRHSDESPSLLPGHDDKFHDRTSSTFIGADVSGLTVEWDPQPGDEEPVDRITFRNRTTGETVAVAPGSKAAKHFATNSRWLAVGAPAPQPDPEPLPTDGPTFAKPPKAGPGSSRAAWEAYAHFRGLTGTDGLTRSQLIEALDADAD